jgi:hypothetical protein
MFAPEIGASGYIGFPSADASCGPEPQPPNFGYLYEGFAGIQLITWHMDLLYDFFRTHAGHRIQTFGDGEPLLGNGGTDAVAPDPGDDALRPLRLQRPRGPKQRQLPILSPGSACIANSAKLNICQARATIFAALRRSR